MKRSVDAKELKEIASIIEIISKYVQLKKTGRTYKGLSPFTNEKTPSLIVNPEGQFFKDFSSGKGGDVFTFLMEYHRYSFKEALEEVAEYYGYSITNTFNKKKSGGKSVKERLINLNNIAQQEYRRQFKETASGEIARQYIKKRSISSDMVDMFGIGYVPDEWNTITDLFIKANIPKEDLEKTDLVIKSRKNNKYYDRFRFRLMFPIYDENDKLIGFGGRTLGKGKSTGTDPAKYLNSSDSELFNKSSLLYNLNLAKNEIREMETVIITEGYLDVIACYQNGIRNVVAPMGTALTPNQLKKLERYAKKIILMFDGDRAGINAAVKSIDIIFQTNLETSVVILPEAQDPYDYLLKYGKDELKFLLNNAQDGLDFKLNNIAKNYDLKTAKGKENFINQSFYFLNSTKNRIIIEVGLKKIAGIVKLPEDTIREYFKESKKSNNYNNKNKIRKELYNKNEQNIKEPLSHKFQRIILSSLVANEKEAEYYIPKLNENMFTNSFYRKVFSLFKELIAQEGELTIDYVQEQLTDEENNKFKSIIDSKDEYKLDSENLKKTLSQTINNLKLLYIENRIKKNQINIKEAEKSGNLILLKEYMEEAQYLLYERKKFYDIKFNIDKE